MSQILEGLNSAQKKAVQTVNGPLIVFAGAGTGKTRVLTRRAAYMIEKGYARPEQILAITFTNKAAKEMKNRIYDLVGDQADSMVIATFHSMCVRFLRKYGYQVGYSDAFSIYDTDDVKSLLHEIIHSLGYQKLISDRVLQYEISQLKNRGCTAEDYKTESDHNHIVAKCYEEYEERMFMNNAMDFDDLLLQTKILLDECQDVREELQNQFRYILIDEYQDTNHIQFEIAEMLAEEHQNICVVGDDDQSIYKFRGADIDNILNFSDEFYGTKKVFLTRNYRSTGTILEAANAVIANNEKREKKELYTEQEPGEKIQVFHCTDQKSEAKAVIQDIKTCGYSYSDIAILYRSNSASRSFEESCIFESIPYQILSGISFYQRKEIKDLTAYLRILVNPSDEAACKRILNVPRRGIGAASIEKVDEYAKTNKISFYQALSEIKTLPAKTEAKVLEFISLLKEWKKKYEAGDPNAIADYITWILEKEGYLKEIEKDYDPEDASKRRDNCQEFLNKIKEKGPSLDLISLLEEIALVTEKKEETEKVTMMTLHSSKGLEYKKVYLVGMNETMFPTAMALRNPESMEEERRLAYVGITRAKESLTLTYTDRRMIYGKTNWVAESRFLEEIPNELLKVRNFS